MCNDRWAFQSSHHRPGTAVGGQAKSPTVQTDFKLDRPDENIKLPEAAVKPTREKYTSRYGGSGRGWEGDQRSREEYSTVLSDWMSGQRC